MLDWLAKLFRGRGVPTRPQFRYQVDGRRRSIDPREAQRRLYAFGGGLWPACYIAMEKLRHPVTAGEAERWTDEDFDDRLQRFHDALEQSTRVIRAAFELPPLDARTGRGVTEAEAIGVLIRFTEFLDGLNRPQFPQPIRP